MTPDHRGTAWPTFQGARQHRGAIARRYRCDWTRMSRASTRSEAQVACGSRKAKEFGETKGHASSCIRFTPPPDIPPRRDAVWVHEDGAISSTGIAATRAQAPGRGRVRRRVGACRAATGCRPSGSVAPGPVVCLSQEPSYSASWKSALQDAGARAVSEVRRVESGRGMTVITEMR